MRELNIYIETGIRGPCKRNGIVGYIIEMRTEKGPATLTNFIRVEDVAENRAVLCAVTAALSRIKEKCVLNIFTNSNYLYLGFEIENRAQKWAQAGWKNRKGQEIKNLDKWQETLNLLNGSLYRFHLNERNEYGDWLARETEKRQAALQHKEIGMRAKEGTHAS